MKMTTKGRYAVTAMLDLALYHIDRPISLMEISQRQSISLTYLEQLFSKLKRHGLVDSVRGPGGGYRLAVSADAISVAKIVFSVDETVDVTRCGGQQNCQAEARCLTHDLWMEFNRHISDFLNGITLADLIERNNVKQVAERQALIWVELQKH